LKRDDEFEPLDRVLGAGRHLLVLINDILDLSKIEAQQLTLDEVPFHLPQVLDDLAAMMSALASDKGLALVIEADDATREPVIGDPVRLTQILTNLLGNAIKFTEHGSVTLRVVRPAADVRFGRPELTPERTVALMVSDTGIGIPHQEQDRVFAPFQQIDARTDRRYGGTGLGLSIARELAVLLGGELQLESAPGKGSTFTLYLPEQGPGGRAAAEEAAHAPLPVVSSPSSGGPLARVDDDRATLKPDEPHLLIIEDDQLFAAQLAEIIHARRFKVLIATEGREGLRLAKANRPQGIGLDGSLPDVDGRVLM